jgi:hypothetical protein
MKLNGYKEVVSENNFIELAQMYSDVGFKPGSTAKADFLGELSNQLINRFQAADSAVLVDGGRARAAGLDDKEISIWSRSTGLMAALDKQGWSGRMLATKGDYLRVVDANLSGNKSNFYVTRHTDYAINVDRNSGLNSVAKVTWEHSGKSATWPGGDYLNFVRIYVPAGAGLRSSTGFEKDSFAVTQDGDKTVFQGFVRVPYGSKKSVEVRYSLPGSLSLPERNGAYDLTWQKQAGIVEEPVSIRFNTPLFLEPQDVSAGGQVGDDGVILWKSAHAGNARYQATLTNRRGT